MNKFAVDFNMIPIARLRAEIGARFSVNGDPASGNQFIAMTSRTNAGRGEKTI